MDLTVQGGQSSASYIESAADWPPPITRVPRNPKVAQFCADQWPNFAPPLTVGIMLVSEDDRTISEMANVRLDDLPSGMALHPPEAPIEADWGPDGAYTFQMTSQRGPNPIFRPGELFETLFRVGQDAWMYCFYTDSNGEMLQLLPNPFQESDPNANFYAGGRVHLYRDPERLPRPDPFDIVINDDTVGTEVFQCIAESRNVTNDLPEQLRGTTMAPVPQRYAFRLRQIFEDLVDVRVAQASVTVTVLP